MTHLMDTIKLLFRKDKELYSVLYKMLGFYPHDIELYRLALMHRSVGKRDKNGHRVNNERLEFLGDAVIESAVSDILYRHFEEKDEGYLTNTRSKIVQRSSLGKLADEIGLTRLVQCSRLHQQGHNSYIGGNAFEALMGAVYLDRGYRYVFRFLERRILTTYINIDEVAKKEINFKSKLLEWSQRNKLRTAFLSTETKSEGGRETVFVAQVEIEGVTLCKSKGYSKKESQQKASKEALRKLSSNEILQSILSSKEKRTAMEASLISAPPKVRDDHEGERGERKPRPTRKRNRRRTGQAGTKAKETDGTKKAE